MTAPAGFVPCAEVGIKQILRWASPRDGRYSRIASNPAYSPCDPAFGCNETAANPVISASHFSSCENSSAYPRVCSDGANGCIRENSGQVTGNISLVALSFIVHEPSGIMLVVSD